MIEEIVVTGSYIENSPPAQRVVRKADNLLLRVQITNDAREREQREKEIHKTLLSAVAAAQKSKNIELSSVTDSGFVIPLNRSNHRIELNTGIRPDTSQAYFRVKARIDKQSIDGEALVLSLKRFVSELGMEGRTLAEVDGDVEVSILNPQQYRSSVIELMANDVKNITSALGPDYRVVLTGIDRPVQWARVGSIDVAIFIPYEYVVVPTSISAFNMFPDY
ncbi:MAG: hypothetical protein ACFHXK_00805 [bacterium]